MGSKIEHIPWTNIQDQHNQWSKEIKSGNFCYHKVGRVITIVEAIEESALYTIFCILLPAIFFLPIVKRKKIGNCQLQIKIDISQSFLENFEGNRNN